MPTPVIVDFTPIECLWCGASSADTIIQSCSGCGYRTCYECVNYLDDGLVCIHTPPKQRRVVTSQTWDRNVS